MCVDDDKEHLSIMKGCDNLKLNHHAKDNRNGLTNHTLATSGLGFNLSTEYDKPDDTIISVTKTLMQKTFSGSGSRLNIPHVVLHLDRGYWCWDIVIFLISACCSTWGAIKRVPWFPFTCDQWLRNDDKCVRSK